MSDPEAVRRGVLRAWRAVQLAHHAEALLIGLTAALLVLAAAGFDGVSPTERDPLAVALVAALAAGTSWVASHRVHPSTVADAVDRHLRFDGALFAAFEASAPGERAPSTMARLLARRVVGRSAPQRWMRSAVPNSMPWIAAPLLAALVLSQAIPDPRADALERGDPASILGRMRGHLDAAVSAGLEAATGEPELAMEQVRDLLEVAREGRRLPLEAPVVDRWLESAAELAAELPADSGARERLLEAATLGEAAALALEEPAPAGGAPRRDVEVPSRDPSAGGAASRGERGAGGDGASDGRSVADGTSDPGSSPPGSGSEVAGGGADGTMSGHPPPDELAGDPAVAPSGTDRGLATDRWWSRRDADLVRRWVEVSRARAASAGDRDDNAPPP